MEFLDDLHIEYTDIKEKSQGFLVKLRNSDEFQRVLGLNGRELGEGTLRITRTKIPRKSRAIFKMVADDLKIKEEALSRRKVGGDQFRRVQQTGRGEARTKKKKRRDQARVVPPIATKGIGLEHHHRHEEQ
jgi:hypothetical protein